MPRRDGPENLRFLKKNKLKVDNGPCRHTIEFLPLGHRIEFSAGQLEVESWILTIEDVVGFFGSLPTEILDITRCAVLGMVSVVWLRKTFNNYVSLLVSKNRTQKLIKLFVPEQQSPACVFVLYGLHMYTYYNINNLIHHNINNLMIHHNINNLMIHQSVDSPQTVKFPKGQHYQSVIAEVFWGFFFTSTDLLSGQYGELWSSKVLIFQQKISLTQSCKKGIIFLFFLPKMNHR